MMDAVFTIRLDRWWKPNIRREDVEVGAIFRRIRRGHIIETAKVLEIAPDSMGVPHVHYAVSIRGGQQRCIEEQRTLGLVSFAERFTKIVAG